MDAVIIIAAFALAIFWCYQFVLLMMMEDDLFPGRGDKLIWGLCFFIVAPLAPIVFLLWRKTTLQIKTQPEAKG
jgi:hypothetical protein